MIGTKHSIKALQAEKRQLQQHIAELEQQLAEQTRFRHESEERFRAFIQTVDTVIIVLSPDFHILEWNQAAERIYGWPRQEVLNRSYRELFLVETEWDAMLAHSQPILQGKPGSAFENLVRARDGTVHSVAWHPHPLLNSQGQLTAIVLNGHAPPHHQLTEQECHQRWALLHTILDNAPVPIFAKDVQGRLILANRPFDEFFQVKRGSFIGKTDNEFLPPEIAEQHRAHDRQVLTNKQPIEFEEVIPCEDGLHTYISVKFPISNADGEIYAIAAVCTEITERKRAEAFLRLSYQQLARAAHTRNHFLTNIGHSLRSPLSVILGLSQVLLEEDADPLSDRQRELLENIEESGQQFLGLINETLELFRIEVGKVALNMGPFSVDDVCKSSVRLISQSAYQKRLTVTCHIQPDITTMYTDRRYLKQILLNMLDNAVKFTPEYGQIGLDVSYDEKSDMVCFTIWDTGSGIVGEHIPWLFKPSPQLDGILSKRYTPYTWTGLGLILVARLVELLGGHIAVESEIRKGSRFTLSLPRHLDQPRESLVELYPEIAPGNPSADRAIERPSSING